MTVEDNIAVFFFCGTFDYIEVIFDCIAVTVSGEYIVFTEVKDEFIWCKAGKIAVSCDTDYFLFIFHMHQDKAVQISFAVTEVDKPVGIGIAEDNFFNSLEISV
jgi:hypothetical protein